MKSISKILFPFLAAVILIFGNTPLLNPPVGNWYQQFLPNLNGRNITDIFFIDSLTGYAVTNNLSVADTGYILKTTNGGDNWSFSFIVNRGFTAIEFINLNTGYACGGSGGGTTYLCKTSNGGMNWSMVSSPSAERWDDISVLSEDTMWLVDDVTVFGGVFFTANGGASWIQQYNGNNPNKIYMYNWNLGFFSPPSGGALFRTTNGGGNWTQVPGADGFTDMRFVDSMIGYKCRSFMKKTTDGGLTWVQQTLPSGGNIIGSGMSKISYVSQTGDTLWGLSGEIIVVAGTRGTLYHTTNGGNEWRFQLPDTSIHISFYYHGIFIDKKFGWNYTTNTGIHTTTGGDTTFVLPVKQISNEIPKEYKLYQNYPNPFNQATKIKFQLSKPAYIEIRVFDVSGRLIKILAAQKMSSGIFETDFNGSDLSSGVYFYSLKVNYTTFDTKKMVLVK